MFKLFIRNHRCKILLHLYWIFRCLKCLTTKFTNRIISLWLNILNCVIFYALIISKTIWLRKCWFTMWWANRYCGWWWLKILYIFKGQFFYLLWIIWTFIFYGEFFINKFFLPFFGNIPPNLGRIDIFIY